jgi:hypothetical protein
LTHNDGGHPASIYALDVTGSLVGELPLEGTRNEDWEDIATGDCQAGSCIYLADVGDNGGSRKTITLYRLKDPGTYTGDPAVPDAFPMVLPNGPRDIEALFILPGEEAYLLTKGRRHGATLYRYPPPLRKDEPVVLEPVQTLSDGPLSLPQQFTGADASPDGRLVALRTYSSLEFFRVEEGRLMPLRGGKVDLRTLNEAQGEAVGLGPNGEVALSSEGLLMRGATMALLQCDAAFTEQESGRSPGADG